MRSSKADTLPDDEQVKVFNYFLLEVKRRENGDGNKLTSYGMVLDMIDDICIELGYAACPTCGRKGVKQK